MVELSVSGTVLHVVEVARDSGCREALLAVVKVQNAEPPPRLKGMKMPLPR